MLLSLCVEFIGQKIAKCSFVKNLHFNEKKANLRRLAPNLEAGKELIIYRVYERNLNLGFIKR